MGGLQGLDYTAAESLMRIRRIRNRGEMLDKLRVMEHAYLDEIHGGSGETN